MAHRVYSPTLLNNRTSSVSVLLIIRENQGRSQEFVTGEDKRGRLGNGSPPVGFRSGAPVGVWGEAARTRRHMLNVRLNKVIDRQKSRTVQSPIILF